MDEQSKVLLNTIGVVFETVDQLDGFVIEREQLLSIEKYDDLKKQIPSLKKTFSSSFMTSLQEPAFENQRWPLLNLVRQILNVYNFKMVPVRKSDGYTPEGVKKYKRFFRIEHK